METGAAAAGAGAGARGSDGKRVQPTTRAYMPKAAITILERNIPAVLTLRRTIVGASYENEAGCKPHYHCVIPLACHFATMSANMARDEQRDTDKKELQRHAEPAAARVSDGSQVDGQRTRAPGAVAADGAIREDSGRACKCQKMGAA